MASTPRSAPANAVRRNLFACVGGPGNFLCATLRAQRATSRVAIEGVLRQEAIDIAQLAVDTHGHTDLGMAVSHGTGFDMCPRLNALKDRHLFLPRGCEVPEILKSIWPGRAMNVKSAVFECGFVRSAVCLTRRPYHPAVVGSGNR